MLKKKYKVLEKFAHNPTREYLFNDIKNYINSKSESYTYNSLQFFVDNGIIKKEKRSGVSFYKIANTAKAASMLALVSEYIAWERKELAHIINRLITIINSPYFTLMVTGSYAKGTHNKKSDIDLIIIVPSDTKKILADIKHFCEINIPPIHPYVFTADEFKQMLLDRKHNYGKEAIKNNLLFIGGEFYYMILFEAMKNWLYY